MSTSEKNNETPDDESYQSGLPGFLGVIDFWISRLEAVVLAVGVLLMALNTVLNAVMRAAIDQSIFFSEELNSILIVMVTFAGISYAARFGRHIRMSAIYDALSPKLRKIMMVIITLFTAAVLFLLTYYSYTYIKGVADSGRLLPAMGIPVYIGYLYVPVGFFLTGIQYLLTAIKNLRSRETYISTQVLEGYDDNHGI